MISNELKQRLKDLGQFPYGKRDRAYQSIDGEPGIRDMNHRYEVIQFPKSFDGETVIDFGCSAGAICLDAKKRGAKRAVGLDYKEETIQVAKSLAKEMDLDVEFYTFNIDDGLDGLKSLIGEDKFDHVFALSIWAHCDENKLADMINFYTDKVCWFEGHNATTYGDTKSKMDLELERLLDLPYHEYIGETSDRSVRQNYKLSRSLRIDLNNKNEYTYFSGDVYQTVKEANHDYKDKKPGGNHLLNKNSYVDGKYNYNGKYSCYIADSNSDIGYKILNFDPSVTNLEDKYNYAKTIFDVQWKLSLAGFAPKPLEILKCHDSQTFYHAIKMQNIKGKFVQPNDEWIEKLVSYCRENGITRSGWSVSDDCVPKNCIEMGGNIYLVDIDYKWVLLDD
jgi:hypothetical protein|tara:strand:+ start:7581 stop:8759 length:1179 start_codon:yes stop_codon:yes gene_type:complete